MTKNLAKKVGRPLKITNEVLRKLEQAFSFGCTDEEACLFADVSIRTLYDYQKKDDKFSHRKALLKEKPVLKARNTVVENLGEVDTAKWYLEKKKPQEFGKSNDVNVPIQVNVNLEGKAKEWAK